MRAVEGGEHLLGDLFGLVAIADDAPRDRDYPWLRAPEEAFERIVRPGDPVKERHHP